MARTVDDKTWMTYIELRKERGLTMSEACKVVDIAYGTGQKFERGDPTSSGHHLFHLWQAGTEDGELTNGPIPLDLLGGPARLGLSDFEFFRRRHMGMPTSPWQSEANAVFDELYRKDEQRRYIVFNMPPESGKTTFMHDKVAQLTVRDRAIKGLIGSYANNMAWKMLTALGNTFIRVRPWEAPDQARLGGAFDAESTLWRDYGRFQPEDSKKWNRSELAVLQHGEQIIGGKEATWTSYGRESGQNLGARYDFIVWDDLVSMKSMGKDPATMAELFSWWDTEGETRLNMGGLLVLLGQRIGADDLYRHALDKMGFAEGEHLDLVPTGKKYVHLCYKAHDDENCKGDEFHRRDSEPWRPDGTGGCVLEPKRISWTDQLTIKFNNANHYATQYQQEDGDPASVLVPPIWIKGGLDPVTNEMLPGCWDMDRHFWQLPPQLPNTAFGVVTIDPSVTNHWGMLAWVYVPDDTAVRSLSGSGTGVRYLLNAECPKNMDAPKLLEFHPVTRVYTGMIQDWYEEYQRLGVKLKWVIFEAAGAQRWALQYETIRRWYGYRDIRVIPHQTHGWNKPDEKLGITMLKTPYRHGLTRLPYRAKDTEGMKTLLHQLTKYSETYRGMTDMLMSNWFLESNLQHMVRTKEDEYTPPPSQMRSLVSAIGNVGALLKR